MPFPQSTFLCEWRIVEIIRFEAEIGLLAHLPLAGTQATRDVIKRA